MRRAARSGPIQRDIAPFLAPFLDIFGASALTAAFEGFAGCQINATAVTGCSATDVLRDTIYQNDLPPGAPATMASPWQLATAALQSGGNSSAGLQTPAAGPAGISLTPGFAPIYRGIAYVSANFDTFATADSLGQMAAEHINATAVTTLFGINAVTNTIYQNDVPGGYTESDTGIGTAVHEAVSDGLQVMVRPLINFLYSNANSGWSNPNPLNGSYSNGEFRNYYDPGPAGSTGANSFFLSYGATIVQQAQIAQAEGASLFCIGAEIDQLTGPAYETYWNAIITAVRHVFSGALTYSALWDDDLALWQGYSGYGSGNEAGTGYITSNLATQVSFWGSLDYIGIDEYAPLSYAADPTLQDLINAWTEVPTAPETLAATGGRSLIDYYESLSIATGKPLLFTEIGYPDTTTAASNPTAASTSSTPDPALQAELYQAFFDAWSQDGNSRLAGTFFWDWSPGGAGLDPFSPQGLPALAQLQAGYSQGQEQALCYLRGTSILTIAGERPVEALRIGDLVITRFHGPRRIEWIGHQRFAAQFLAGDPARRPVRIAAGALGPGVPRRHLYVSPGHSMLLGETLILARHLINGVTITQQVPPEDVHYLQLDFGMHDCVLAEGAWGESFADGPGLRACFHNVAAFFLQMPAYVAPREITLCAPRPQAGAAFEHALAPAAARAAALCVPGALLGWLERQHPNGLLQGWAVDAGNPALPVALELWHRGSYVASALACRPRADVQAAGYGHGQSGFLFLPPSSLDLAGFSIRRAADGALLKALEPVRKAA